MISLLVTGPLLVYAYEHCAALARPPVLYSSMALFPAASLINKRPVGNLSFNRQPQTSKILLEGAL
jgi:hypothetical protein